MKLPKPVAWLCTDFDGHFGLGVTKELAKSKAGEFCNDFLPLHPESVVTEFQQRIEALEAELAACKRDAAKHRFLDVTCSQCGRNFGPGNFGFSRCEDHTGESYNLGIDDAAKWLDKRADDYDSEHGSTDPDTGTREYPGDGLDYINELRENADSIRELKRAAIDAAMAAGEPE